MENKILELENKKETDEWCERCTGDFASYWMEEFDEMWCRDCRDGYIVGLFTYKRKNAYNSKIENTSLNYEPETLKDHIKREIRNYSAM